MAHSTKRVKKVEQELPKREVVVFIIDCPEPEDRETGGRDEFYYVVPYDVVTDEMRRIFTLETLQVDIPARYAWEEEDLKLSQQIRRNINDLKSVCEDLEDYRRDEEDSDDEAVDTKTEVPVETFRLKVRRYKHKDSGVDSDQLLNLSNGTRHMRKWQ
jgi:hypothetical protein